MCFCNLKEKHVTCSEVFLSKLFFSMFKKVKNNREKYIPTDKKMLIFYTVNDHACLRNMKF